MAYTKGVRFEWDSHKNQANRKKHGLSFDQAVELFTGDNDYLEIYDESTPSRRIVSSPLVRYAPVLLWRPTGNAGRMSFEY